MQLHLGTKEQIPEVLEKRYLEGERQQVVDGPRD